ncbi:MAG: hypothetical protein GF346_06780, partial [Candidatus Eisenbacteria bacterium]|nr:hypothetical protein [Candidatus Latescibacterota bacterium]MBD3302133.1 hypothetical protein [Candidatus Eisenbacteria bacterium]
MTTRVGRDSSGAPDKPVLEFRPGVDAEYPDVFTDDAKAALVELARFNVERLALMEARIARRAARARDREPIRFLDPDSIIPRTR